MKIVNECKVKTKAIEDLESGEVFMYSAFPYMKVTDRYDYRVGCPIVRLTDGEIIFITSAQVELLNAELHIKKD